MKKHSTLLVVVALGLAGLLQALSSKSSAQGKGNPNPGVLPVQSKPYGLSYGEWSARWWRWAFSLPVDAHPLFDTADCSAGQTGPVWFLGGKIDASPQADGSFLGEAERDCTVPVGKALFFPILNSECSTLEGNGTTEAELRACAVGSMDHIKALACEVDGVALQSLEDYRAESPLFTYGPLPDNNTLQFLGVDAPEGSTSPSVSDGVFVLLAPLPAGEHTLHFSGTLVFTFAEDGFDFIFEEDITYHLTVVPGR